MQTLTDSFILHNGVSMPCVGFGTYKTPEGEVVQHAVKTALRAGYRHIDTAAFYGNESGIGTAILDSGVPRGEIFITSKVWNTERGYDRAKASFHASLERLKTDYLDLLLIHWPANRLQFGDAAEGINAETWRAFEDLYNEGLVRAIGLSNFQPHHIEALMKTARIAPMVDQIEFHPGWLQPDTVGYCKTHGIVVEAWSPLARNGALGQPTLLDIAAAHGKSSAQVCIRWVLQHGLLPLPKSVTDSRILENTDVFDFTLSDEEMQRIDALTDCGGMCYNSDEIDF